MVKSLSLGVTVLFVIIVCLSAGPASAAMDFTWQQVMVGGGGGFTFTAISPYDSNFILLQGDMGSSYVSRDGGATWSFLPKNVAGGQHQFCFHPTDHRLIFLAADLGLFKSTNKGVSWTRIPTPWDGDPNRWWRVPIGNGPFRMAFNPARPDHGIAIRDRKVLVTSNRGASWTSAGPAGRRRTKSRCHLRPRFRRHDRRNDDRHLPRHQ